MEYNIFIARVSARAHMCVYCSEYRNIARISNLSERMVSEYMV